ncbi:MAG TPA: hypothetical protein VM680_10565 [Verrucomicrobiae bacterium]|nr:hypothetical protein [Verrucomicrobiae bacterium]
MKWFLLVSAIGVLSGIGEEWRKIAFIGDAEVKSISGVVELVNGSERVLRANETATVGHTLRIWQGSEVVLVMKNTKSLVRAKGPCLLRLAADKDDGYKRAEVNWEEPKTGFVVRAVRGGGKYQDGPYWRCLEAGMTIPEGTRVRPYRDSILDFYHPGTRTAYRVTDHKKQTLLVAKQAEEEESSPTILAAKNP